jgi:hypothetical protein
VTTLAELDVRAVDTPRRTAATSSSAGRAGSADRPAFPERTFVNPGAGWSPAPGRADVPTVISAFAAGFDLAAVVVFAAVAAALGLYDRLVGVRFRLAHAQARLVLVGATAFAVVNTAAVVELILALRAEPGHLDPARAETLMLQGAAAAAVAALLGWRHARRGAERAFDTQLVQLTER